MADYKYDEREGISIIAFPEKVEARDPKRLETEIKVWLVTTSTVYVLDFASVQSLDASAYRPLVRFIQVVRAHEKQLFSVNLSPETLLQIKQDGLLAVFNPIDSFERAKRKAGLPD